MRARQRSGEVGVQPRAPQQVLRALGAVARGAGQVVAPRRHQPQVLALKGRRRARDCANRPRALGAHEHHSHVRQQGWRVQHRLPQAVLAPAGEVPARGWVVVVGCWPGRRPPPPARAHLTLAAHCALSSSMGVWALHLLLLLLLLLSTTRCWRPLARAKTGWRGLVDPPSARIAPGGLACRHTIGCAGWQGGWRGGEGRGNESR